MGKLNVRQAVQSMQMASPVWITGEVDSWALPITLTVRRRDRLYTAYVGDYMKRTFDSESMPDVMKNKLSLLLPAVNAVKHVFNPEWNGSWRTYPPPDCLEGFSTIGWYEGHSEWCDAYTLVMTWPELMELRGEPLK